MSTRKPAITTSPPVRRRIHSVAGWDNARALEVMLQMDFEKVADLDEAEAALRAPGHSSVALVPDSTSGQPT